MSDRLNIRIALLEDCERHWVNFHGTFPSGEITDLERVWNLEYCPVEDILDMVICDDKFSECTLDLIKKLYPKWKSDDIIAIHDQGVIAKFADLFISLNMGVSSVKEWSDNEKSLCNWANFTKKEKDYEWFMVIEYN